MEMEVGSGTNPSYRKLEDGSRSRNRKRCLLIAIGTILFIVVLILILYFAVLKPKKATTTIDSISLNDLNFKIDALRLAVALNLSLGVHVSIRNPNKAGFRYRNSTVLLNYRGDRLVGVVPLPAGNVPSDSTVGLNLTVTVFADRLLSDSQVFSDIVSGGKLPFTMDVRLSGKVKVLGFIKFHVVTSSSCKVTVNVNDRSIEDQECTQKVKL